MLRLTAAPAPAGTPGGERPRIALQGLTPEELAAAVPEILLAEARRIVSTVHRGGDFTAPHSGVRRSARHAVCERGHVPTLAVASQVQSQTDSFLKLALRTGDGRLIEAVRIPLERPGRFSVCVSSQVGCALGCAFCATGRLGLGDVQNYMSRMVRAGLTHAVLETTSHGLAQHRVDACEFDAAVVTNVTHEHLDAHGSFEDYLAAKARLFHALDITKSKQGGNQRFGVINRDDISYEFLKSATRVRTISYSVSQDADVAARLIRQLDDGQEFTVDADGLRVVISTRLPGIYNVSNCLAAFGTVVLGLGVPAEAAKRGIASLGGVPGRMERIELGQDFTAIVDFAHTPNALKSALQAAKTLLRPSHRRARIIAVFGSAGLRDKGKRRLMAETAAEMADLAILTAEDPRTESLESILAEMAAGAAAKGGREGETFWRIPDRGNAIRFAAQMAREGDIVIACGKGHEQSMCFGVTEHAWDDRTAMRAALSELLGLPGAEMPYLPTRDQPEGEWLR